MKALYLKLMLWYLHKCHHYLGVTYNGKGELAEIRDYGKYGMSFNPKCYR